MFLMLMDRFLNLGSLVKGYIYFNFNRCGQIVLSKSYDTIPHHKCMKKDFLTFPSTTYIIAPFNIYQSDWRKIK